MRLTTTLTCVSLLTLLAACSEPDGYYDAHGKFIHNTPYNNTKNVPDQNRYVDSRYNDTNTNVNYSRRGYYDYNGYYIAKNYGPVVPSDMFPPRGMCRVWFPDRDPADQPEIETCAGIRSRVPAGAYVIFGG